MKTSDKQPLHILLADDDESDRYFFRLATGELPMPFSLETVQDGEQLMNYLNSHTAKLPDVLFLDVNMPRKNGMECLIEIKQNSALRELPVIIYSTSLNDTAADLFYQNGAHYYLRKCDFKELIENLAKVLNSLQLDKFGTPSREEFVLNYHC